MSSVKAVFSLSGYATFSGWWKNFHPRVALLFVLVALLGSGLRALGLNETVTYTMTYYLLDQGPTTTAVITIHPSGFENDYVAKITVKSHQFTSFSFAFNKVTATLDDGQFTVLRFPDDFREQTGTNLQANEVKATAAASVTVPNSTLDIATTSDGLYTVAVGFANTTSPISLVNNTTNKVQSLSYPGQAGEVVDIGDDDQTVLAAIGTLGQPYNIIRLLTISSGTLTDTGTTLTVASGTDQAVKLRVAPGSHSGVAMVVSGDRSSTKLVSFTLPGLVPTGTVTLAGASGTGLAIKPDGTEVFARSGSQSNNPDTIEGFSYNATTGAFGNTTAVLTIPNISFYSSDGYPGFDPLAVTPDGTQLVAVEQDANNALPSPRLSFWNSSTGTLVDTVGVTGTPYTVETEEGAAITGPPTKATVTLSNLSQPYTGSPDPVTVTTNPADLTTSVTYSSKTYPASTTAPTNVGSYTATATITDPNYTGGATGTLIIKPANATVALGGLSATYDGNSHAATAVTTPPGLTVNFTYNGKTALPVAAGSYKVVGMIDSPDYTGSATGTLVIAKASATVTLAPLSLNATYTGKAVAATATTLPTGLPVTFAYTQNGKKASPVNAGSYVVTATVNTANAAGSATGTLTISPAAAVVNFGPLAFVANGKPHPATATTVPAGLAVTFTYDGSSTAPSADGNYAVVATINNPNYTGSADGTLAIVPVLPVVTSAAPTLISAQGATLNGKVNPNGGAALAYFQYGTSTSYGSTTSVQNIASGSTAVAFNANVSGLLPGTKYYYRAAAAPASDSSAVVYGASETFTTLAEPVFASAPQAPQISASGVGVGFGVNPEGVATTVHFIYGTSANSLTESTGTLSLGAGKTTVVGTSFLGTLLPNRTYYYELVSVSAAGTFYGPEESFTTPNTVTTLITANGDPAPGTGGDFNGFSAPGITNNVSVEGVSFLADLIDSGSINSTNDYGLWAYNSAGTLKLIAQEGSPAPDTPATFSNDFIDIPVYNDSFEVAFGAGLDPSTGSVTLATESGIWSTSTGTLRLAAREGDAAPGGSTFSQLLALGISDDNTIVVSQMAVTGTVTSANNIGIWEGTLESNLALKLRTGEVVAHSGGPVASGTITGPLVLNSSEALLQNQTRFYNNTTGDLCLLANFTNKSTGIVTEIGGTSELLYAVGDPAPVATGSATFAKFSVPIINASNHLAFEATLATATGVTTANNAGIWVHDGAGPLQLVARTGSAVPDASGNATSAVFTALSDPLNNVHDAVAFSATYKSGTSVVTGLFCNSSGALALVAQTGQAAPGCGAGVNFGAFTTLTLPDGGGATGEGGLVFEATLTGTGVTSANNTGIWAVDSTGTPQLIVRTGDSVNVGTGGSPNYKTISSLLFSTFLGSTAGETLSVAKSGDLAYTASFTDKTSAIFAVQLP